MRYYHAAPKSTRARGGAFCALIVFAVLAFAWGIWQDGCRVQSKEAVYGENIDAITEEDLSNIDHGNTLSEVMEGIRQEDFEVTVAFSSDGQKLFEYTNYSNDGVEASNDHVQLMRRYSELILLHNHPVWDKASFSNTDLKKLASYNAGLGIIVSKSDTYVLMPAKEWPSAQEIDEFTFKHADLMEGIWIQNNYGHGRTANVTTKAFMELLADEFDLYYYEWSKSNIGSEEIATVILGK